jgi:hypothetical protein
MRLEFNNLAEIFNFLEEIGYNVTKKCCKTCKEKEERDKVDDENLIFTEEKIKDLKFPPSPSTPYNPFTPYYPIYADYPITTTTYDAATQDPEFSKKISMEQSKHTKQ